MDSGEAVVYSFLWEESMSFTECSVLWNWKQNTAYDWAAFPQLYQYNENWVESDSPKMVNFPRVTYKNKVTGTSDFCFWFHSNFVEVLHETSAENMWETRDSPLL